jgi:hypothetical protein
MQPKFIGLTVNKFSLLFLVLLATINFYSFSQTKGGLPPIKNESKIDLLEKENDKPKLINPSGLINEGWSYFIGENNFVDEKKAYDYTLAAVNLIDKSPANAKVLSIAKNNLSVIYLCSINKSIRNTLKGEKYSQDFNDDYSIDNLIWATFLKRTPLANDKVEEFYKIVRDTYPAHLINKYMRRLNGIPPNSIESAYSFLKQQALNGDAEASLRFGFSFECAFDLISLDEAIEWYNNARDIYAKDQSNKNRLSSIEKRIKRLQLIKDNKFNK